MYTSNARLNYKLEELYRREQQQMYAYMQFKALKAMGLVTVIRGK